MARTSARKSKAAKALHERETVSAAGVRFSFVVDPSDWTIERSGLQSAKRSVAYASQTAYGGRQRAAPGSGKTRKLSKSLSANWEEALIHSLLEKTLESFREVHERAKQQLTADDLIREVAETLADKVHAPTTELSVEEGWQELLERGLKSKISLLNSKEFKTTSEAAKLLGIGEHAVRKRIKERKLFALRMPVDGEHRIPAWALDPKVTGTATSDLLGEGVPVDEWRFYHFMATPNGGLNGLRPFECLLSDENLPPAKRLLKDELASSLKLSKDASLMEAVMRALKTELAEGLEV